MPRDCAENQAVGQQAVSKPKALHMQGPNRGILEQNDTYCNYSTYFKQRVK